MAVWILVLPALAAAGELLPVQSTQESILVEPLPRNNTSARTIGYPPCGGVTKGLSHTLTEPGSYNPVAWSVRKASPTGMCTIRLSHGSDFSNFQTLVPLEAAGATDKFPCGRSEAYMEKVTVEFPKDFTCDDCTLQWMWETEVGAFYQCVDVQISKGGVSACFGRCKNGGVCVNDQCECIVGFTGVFCETEIVPEAAANFLSVFLLFTLVFLVLLLVAAATFFYVNKFRLSRTSYLFFKRYQPWCLKNPQLDYWEAVSGAIKSPNSRQPVPPLDANP